MSCKGNCFVVMPPNCATDTVILGRNAENENLVGVAQEVYFFDKCNNALEGKDYIDGPALRVILQKPKPGVWGGDCGSNECNVSVAITWSNDVDDIECGLTAFDVVRLTLATSNTADEAVERVANLIAEHGNDDTKFSLIICDPSEAWLISCAGKLWAAHKLTKGYHHLPSDGMAVTTTIDKSLDGLGDALKLFGCWSGEGDINFAACFECSPNSSTDWSGDKPSNDGSYSVTSMFETLRLAANAETSRSASVFVLCNNGISCHWFTGTPNASESVFKPFVFAPHPKISPLTKVPTDNEITLLHKLHGQRKPASLEHLKALEAACVEEVSAYLADHPEVNEELDELMKDCVEAEKVERFLEATYFINILDKNNNRGE